MKKETFYNLDNILSYNAEYMWLLGTRSNGKSYAVKEYVLKDAYLYGNEFAYIRRFKVEMTTASIEGYFDDLVLNKFGVEVIKEITNGEYSNITAWRGALYFSNLGDDMKFIRGKKIGNYFCLSRNSQYKSIAYPRTVNAIFEEAITDEGYLPNEVKLFMNLISTIFRRRQGKIFLIGNTINQSCPYFDEWGMTNVPFMKEGQIDMYKFNTLEIDEEGTYTTIIIAVEFCVNSNVRTKLIFGKNNKNLVSSVWETNEYLHLYKPLNQYFIYYTIFWKKGIHRFKMHLLYDFELKEKLLYVYPYRKKFKYDNRCVTDELSLSRLHSRTLTEVTKYDRIVIDLIENRKICYSDNLIGTTFENCFLN